MSDIENDQQEKQNLEEEKSEELLFDPSLKKKKKKKKAVIFEDEIENDEDAENQAENGDKSAEANEEEVKADDDDISIFADMKKKKKKKKEAADKEKTEEEAAEPSEFGDLPAKRKKKKKTDMLEFEKQLKEGDEVENRQDDDIFVGEGEQDVKETKVEEAWLNSDRDYTYQELLGRVFQILRQNNPELAGEKKRYTIVPPSVHREGNKKTIFANVADICKRMHRQPEHVIQFLFTELGTSGSIDGSQRLVIKGRFQQKQIENVLRRYIVEYVTCKTFVDQQDQFLRLNQVSKHKQKREEDKLLNNKKKNQSQKILSFGSEMDRICVYIIINNICLIKKCTQERRIDFKEKTEEEAAEPSEFGDLPAKRKKKKKTDMLEFEKQLKEGDEVENRQDDDIFVGEGEQDVKETKVEEAWLNSDRDYTYQELLGRVFQILRQNNPELAGEKKRYTIVPPSVHREGNKKTIFANVADICKRMHRQPEHVIQFLFTELGTSGSIDGSQRLVIKGRFQQKQIENVLRRYIVEYVTCKTFVDQQDQFLRLNQVSKHKQKREEDKLLNNKKKNQSQKILSFGSEMDRICVYIIINNICLIKKCTQERRIDFVG
ncbi:unnamed protein product [Rhizophagus irregularis]|nr:unnamed protein product [Rhizophagus irregularis]